MEWNAWKKGKVSDCCQRSDHQGDPCLAIFKLTRSLLIAPPAETVLCFVRPSQRNQWYDVECRKVAEAKNTAYKKTLQSADTRAIVGNYREKRREERRHFKGKKREQENHEREEVEMHRCMNKARKFDQKVKHLTEDYKFGASTCKDENGYLVRDPQEMLMLWRKHFSTPL